MKKTLSLFVFCLSITAVFAQDYVFKARTGLNEYKQLNITLENGNAYVRQSNIAADDALISSIFDLAGVGFQDDYFTIPDDGHSYWFVSFENAERSGPVGSGKVCVECDCMDRSAYGGGKCRKVKSYSSEEIGCDSYACNFCLMRRVSCIGGRGAESTGPFVIVKADKIIFQ